MSILLLPVVFDVLIVAGLFFFFWGVFLKNFFFRRVFDFVWSSLCFVWCFIFGGCLGDLGVVKFQGHFDEHFSEMFCLVSLGSFSGGQVPSPKKGFMDF